MDRLTAIINRFNDGYWTSDSDDRDRLRSDMKHLITALEVCMGALTVIAEWPPVEADCVRAREALRKVEGM